MKEFRNNGAVGALLDEYQKAIIELQEIISSLSSDELKTTVDVDTKDPDCKSIQSILTHVIRSGYNYTIAIRIFLGEDIGYAVSNELASSAEYKSELNNMFAFTEKLFVDHPDLTIEEFENSKKILVRWGQSYDVEQLLEHAIVHMLRHRRQIEKFINKLSNQSTAPGIHS